MNLIKLLSCRTSQQYLIQQKIYRYKYVLRGRRLKNQSNGEITQSILQVELAIKNLLEVESATKVAEIEALSETWDGEVKAVSK